MSRRNSTPSVGFTLVEMLVVIPMVVIIIGVIIGLMTTLVNNVASSNGRTQLMYDAQDALSKIEQDTFLSLGFLTSFTPPTPQGIDNGVGAFTSNAGASTSLILNEYATSNNPANAIREVVYYADRPQACTGNYQTNDPFFTKVIYFVRNNSLYRRVIVPANNQNATPDVNTTCTKPWQRASCASGISGGLCTAVDSTLITNVSSVTMNLTFYNKAAPGVSVAPATADSVSVTLTVNKVIGGKLETITLTLATSQANADSST